MHKLGHFVAGEKVGHLVRWDNLSPEKCKLNNVFLIYMPEIWPKIAQDISKICPRYVQALPKVWGFKLRKWDKMSPGRVHKLGHYVAGEVHNAVGQFVVGTKCLLTSQVFPLSPDGDNKTNKPLLKMKTLRNPKRRIDIQGPLLQVFINLFSSN